MNDNRSGNHTDKIGLLAASIIGINAMIGVGVVTIPAMLFQTVGGPAGIISYLIAILIAITSGITLGRVAHRYPGEGWSYLYPSRWAGHTVGLISGFLYVFGVLIAMGFLIQQAGVWAGNLVPFASPQTLGIVIILVLMGMVLAGTHISEMGQYVIAVCVVVPLAVTALICWFHFDASLLDPFMPKGVGSVFAVVPEIMFALFGFECVVSLYAVVRNPQRNVPRAFLISILFVGTLYLIFSAGLFVSLPAWRFVAGTDIPLSYILALAFPHFRFISIFVLIGTLFGIVGTLHSMLWTTSTLFTDVLKKLRSPFWVTMFEKNIWNNTISIFVATGLMIISAMLFKAKALINLTALCIVVPTVLSLCSLFFIQDEWDRGRNWLTIVAVVGGLIALGFAGTNFVQECITFLTQQ